MVLYFYIYLSLVIQLISESALPKIGVLEPIKEYRAIARI
jgi:hypothetical protein